jgi:hypothetical protein
MAQVIDAREPLGEKLLHSVKAAVNGVIKIRVRSSPAETPALTANIPARERADSGCRDEHHCSPRQIIATILVAFEPEVHPCNQHGVADRSSCNPGRFHVRAESTEAANSDATIIPVLKCSLVDGHRIARRVQDFRHPIRNIA